MSELHCISYWHVANTNIIIIHSMLQTGEKGIVLLPALSYPSPSSQFSKTTARYSSTLARRYSS